MAIEEIPQQENVEQKSFDALLEEQNTQGWHYIEREVLTRTKLDENARFVAVPYQTEEEVKNKWIAKAANKDSKGEYEVKLVPDYNSDKLRRLKQVMSDEEFQTALQNLSDEDKAYFVFLRRKEK